MARSSQDIPGHRQTTVSLVMFGILLAGVGAAAWLVHNKTVPIKRGEAILAQVRSQKLESSWGREPTRQWRIVTDRSGKAVSWVVIHRQFDADRDTYHGKTLRPVEDVILEEKWEISNDGSTGLYLSSVLLPQGLQKLMFIQLADGLVTAVDRGNRRVRAAAPDNYIPEGMWPLVVREVARVGQKAAFGMILDNEAIRGNRLRFVTVTMTPTDSDTVGVEINSAGRKIENIYRLDGAGRIARIENPHSGQTHRLVGEDEIVRAFPDLKGLSQ